MQNLCTFYSFSTVNLIKTAVKKKKKSLWKKRKEGERERGRMGGRKGGKEIVRVGGRKMVDIVEFMWIENNASECQVSQHICFRGSNMGIFENRII